MYTAMEQCTYSNFFVCITNRKEVVIYLYQVNKAEHKFSGNKLPKNEEHVDYRKDSRI